MTRLTVTELISLIADADSFQSWDAPIHPSPDDHPDLARARSRTGRDESIVTGAATLNGRRIAIVAGDYEFLGGSLGVAAGERLTAGIERATAEGLPLVALPVGGGTRMQEGTLAFLQMVKVTQAVVAHKDARLPYLVYLRDPTMGGVFASWGSLGHVQLAQPDALVGFLGPRVYEALYGEPFPPGVQLAENLQSRGIVDAVVPAGELAATLSRILDVMMTRHDEGLTSEAGATPPEPLGFPPLPDTPAWDSVERTRQPDRPGLGELLLHAASHVTMLNGTGAGEAHPGSMLALAKFNGAPCVVLGQCREAQTGARPLDAAALREARRGLRLSRELRLPLVTIIDTPGAALSKEAEESGLAGEIARTLAELVSLETPTVSVLLGQGTGGIALALVPADRVVAAEHAWLAPLPPEGASAIMFRDTAHAPQLAQAQGIRSADLLANGIVDVVVPEPADAASDPDTFTANLAAALDHSLRSVMALPRSERLRRRHARYRNLGAQRVVS
jgi:acetyl-CoA carboxylase carboxyl transferase subunit beta